MTGLFRTTYEQTWKKVKKSLHHHKSRKQLLLWIEGRFILIPERIITVLQASLGIRMSQHRGLNVFLWRETFSLSVIFHHYVKYPILLSPGKSMKMKTHYLHLHCVCQISYDRCRLITKDFSKKKSKSPSLYVVIQFLEKLMPHSMVFISLWIW